MNFTVFCHFYNEEFLLPYWLMHHRRLFDHGVMIDYDSTDRSAEIIRAMAPDWELVRSRNRCFNVLEVDAEVMEHESRFSGWKMALNVTEFLFWDDPKAVFARAEEQGGGDRAIKMTNYIMDDFNERSAPIVSGVDLFLQRGWGIDDDGTDRLFRWTHNARTGLYDAGRHVSRIANSEFNRDMKVLWWGFSPYDLTKGRKMQIRTRVRKEDIDRGMGIQHVISSEEMDRRYEVFGKRSVDLRLDPKYAAVLQRIVNRFGLTR